MSALDCSEVLGHLESHRRGDTSRDLAMLIEDHLARCPRCRRHLAHLKQVSALLSSWRPLAPPAELKIEVADAVSDELGAEARRTYAARRQSRRRRPRRWIMPRMSSTQRLANGLALAALVFLGLAIAWRVWFMPWGGKPGGADRPGSNGAAVTPRQERFVVTLTRCGARREAVVAAVREVTGAAQQEAEMLVDRLPLAVVVGRNLTQGEAADIKARLEAAGAEARIAPVSQPAGGRLAD